MLRYFANHLMSGGAEVERCASLRRIFAKAQSQRKLIRNGKVGVISKKEKQKINGGVMQVSGITMPGYRVYEYLVVLDPHEELSTRIIREKKDFFELYKASTAIGGKPHVTLVNFVQYELMEERLVNRLKTIAMGYYPIKVELKDYGSFPSHTIYINVTSKLPVQNLVKEIRSQAQRLMKLNDDNKPHFILEPYIPIARKLLPWQYEKGWLEYSNKHFTGRFIADGMLLLKRLVGESDSYSMKYQIVEKFQFQNLPVVTKQGELFM